MSLLASHILKIDECRRKIKSHKRNLNKLINLSIEGSKISYEDAILDETVNIVALLKIIKNIEVIMTNDFKNGDGWLEGIKRIMN